MKYHQLPKDKVWLKLGAMALMLMQAALSYGDPGLRALYPPDRKIYIDPNAVTVSGVSSGAYMAVQLHVAYSGTFQGVGAIAGGPYYCAENLPPSLIDTIKLRCMNGFIPPSAAPFIHEAKAAAAAGEIDNLSNLADDKVLIFNSATDQVINPGLGALSVIFYSGGIPIPYTGVTIPGSTIANTPMDTGPSIPASPLSSTCSNSYTATTLLTRRLNRFRVACSSYRSYTMSMIRTSQRSPS